MTTLGSSKRNSNLNLNGKVCIITGAASGIGAATAKLFATLQAQLSIADMDVDGLRNVATECEALSPDSFKPLLSFGDITDETHREEIINSTASTYGRIDILVNNAGIVCCGKNFADTYKDYDKVMDINVKSVYHMTILATPHLIESKGAIVNLSSAMVDKPLPLLGPYNFSKAAVDNFTKLCAIELGPHQVRVNCVRPGSTRTNILRGHLPTADIQAFYEALDHTHALERCGKPDELANVIAFLASDMASFMTGASVHADGGYNLLSRK